MDGLDTYGYLALRTAGLHLDPAQLAIEQARHEGRPAVVRTADGPTARQQRSYADAEAFLQEVIGEVKPGAAFDEVGERPSSRLPPSPSPAAVSVHPPRRRAERRVPGHRLRGHHAGQVEAGMVVSVEAHAGIEGGAEGLELEEQVLMPEGGVEVLSHALHDEHLSGA